MDEFYHWITFAGNCVCKTYTLSYCLFFLFFFSIAILSVNTVKIFLSLCTDRFREEHCFFQNKNFNYVIVRLDWIMFVCVYLQYCWQNHWADAQYWASIIFQSKVIRRLACQNHKDHIHNMSPSIGKTSRLLEWKDEFLIASN
jgi:hypothetical protein